MNCNLYLVSRMMYSLACAGYAPASFGRVSKRGVPVTALLISAAGLSLAMLISILWPSSAYVYLFGVSLFAGLYAWLIIFVTHVFFRTVFRKRIGSFVGAALIAAILLTTWWVEGMRITLIAGFSWLAVLSVMYALVSRRVKSIDPAS